MRIAVSGLSGAGKTTALEHLREIGFGKICYAGAIVRSEVISRDLPLTPENETLVRADLRQARGNDFLAQMVIEKLGGEPEANHALVDAICAPEEADCYRRVWGNALVTLALEAHFDIRVARLAKRVDRPCTPTQLRKRDDYERNVLRLDDVMAAADFRIPNEADVDTLKRELDRLSVAWRSDAA